MVKMKTSFDRKFMQVLIFYPSIEFFRIVLKKNLSRIKNMSLSILFIAGKKLTLRAN
ncbi:MAG: hypothetical protein GAS50_06800 [Desulfobacterales bacterium]|nr:hypothetical protein [Desulfobacterales bacterium]